jgi:hypothetical protein
VFYVVPADVTGSLTVGGSSGSLSVSTPGQHASYTFAGTAGQKISIQIGFGGMSGCNTYSVLNPDNSVLAAATFTCLNGVYVTGAAIVLSQTGTYTIAITPDLSGGRTTSGTGTLSARVFSVPADVTTSLTVVGSGATLTISAPGQHGSYTFSGTTGQKISIQIGFSGMTGCSTYAVLNPDSSSLVASTFTCVSGVYASGAPIVLSQTGTYTINITPDLSGGTVTSGTVTLSSQVFSVPADASGSATIGGSGVTLTISTPGQHGVVTFSGSSGQRINAQMNFASMVGCNTFTILNPDASTLFGSTDTCLSSYSTGALTLSQNGTYTVALTPDISGGRVTSGTGSTTVTINSSP